MTNNLANNGRELITDLKSFIVHSLRGKTGSWFQLLHSSESLSWTRCCQKCENSSLPSSPRFSGLTATGRQSPNTSAPKTSLLGFTTTAQSKTSSSRTTGEPTEERRTQHNVIMNSFLMLCSVFHHRQLKIDRLPIGTAHLPLFWLSSYVTNHHLSVALQSSAKFNLIVLFTT